MSDKETVKETTKLPKVSKKTNTTEAKTTFVRGILGLVLLLVFGSIAFSTVVIFGGTNTIAPKVLIIPQAAFDVFIAFVAFSKILK